MLIYLQMLESEEDKLKFEQLYTHYKGLMFRVAYDILQNKQDAEDAVHQSFLSVIEHFQKISGVNCPKTKAFLVIIVERKSIDILRKQSKLVDLFDDAHYGIEIPLPGDNGLADAMAQLPPRYREVLLLRYDNGYDTKEIASMFNMKRGSVQKLIYRARVELEKTIDQMEIEQ